MSTKMNHNPKTYLSPPTLSGNEIKYVTEAIESGWIAPLGPFVDRFEADLAAFSQTKSCLATSSGTAALHLALLALGVLPGDEVLCSDLTFVASVNAIYYCGAKPILIDSEAETWNMCPDLLEKAICAKIAQGKKPRVLMLVHLYGMPGYLDRILEICQKYDILILEDAAEALGSRWNDLPLGSIGDIGVYSFNGNKIMTTSGGGAIVSNNPKYIEKARYLSTQAKDPSVPHFEHTEVGYNYRMSNILAALGCAQLETIEARVSHRRKVFEHYVDEFKNTQGVQFQLEPQKAKSNRWLTVVTLDLSIHTPQKWADHYASQNIETRPMWKPMHLQVPFVYCESFLNGVGADLFERGICLANKTYLT